MLAGAILGSALISGFAAKKGADAQASAARDSAQAQVRAAEIAAETARETTDKQIAETKRQYDTTREDFKPWREAGMDALAKLKAGIDDGSFTMDSFEFTEDPGYRFRLEEGEKALRRTAAARGDLLSGRQIKNALSYNQGMATEEYGRAYGRERDERLGKFNRLASVSGIGQTATGSTAAAGEAATGRITNALQVGGQGAQRAAYASGDAIAQGAINRGNAYADMYGNFAASANQGIENMLLYKMMG